MRHDAPRDTDSGSFSMIGLLPSGEQLWQCRRCLVLIPVRQDEGEPFTRWWRKVFAAHPRCEDEAAGGDDDGRTPCQD